MRTHKINPLNRLIISVVLLVLTPLVSAQKSLDVRVNSLGKISKTNSLHERELFHFNRTELLSFVEQQKHSSEASFELNFNLNNEHQWQLVLFPSQVLSTNSTSVKNSDRAGDLESNITFKGYLKNKPDSTIRMTISKFLVHMVVKYNNEVYILETSGPEQLDILALNKGDDLLHDLECAAPEQVAQHQNVNELLESVFGENHSPETNQKGVYSAVQRVAKLVIVCDAQCLSKQSGNKAAVNADAQTIVNIVNGYYAEYEVSYQLQPLVFIETASNPWTDYPEDQANHTNSFAGWASSNISAEHNVGMLLTGVNQNGINYAFLSHMCPGDNFRYGMHDYAYSQSLQQRGNLFTHELGHLWGASHVSPVNSSYIMNASVFGGTLSWKDSTRTVLNDAVISFSGCLDEGGPADPYCAVVTGTAAAGNDFISSVAVDGITVKQDNIRIVPRADYTGTVINLDKSASTRFTIVPSNSFELSVIGVWIDWNQDNDFADDNEFISSLKGVGPYTLTISPPADATLTSTRLRIRLGFDGGNVLGSNGELVEACGQFDYDGGETEDYTVNVINSVNQNPIAVVASTILTVTEGTRVELDASGSSDPDGDTFTYLWTQTQGTGLALNNSISSRANFIAPAVSTATTLTFEVTVTDENGASDSASVTVSVLQKEAESNNQSSGGGAFEWSLLSMLLLFRLLRKKHLS